ncbi:MAG TPA: hypothetical protein VFU77_06765, partial [Steroidobacteraceae bacterium]|nr:hypothetical protein [Steroidobacteraceae bacterium]
ELSAPHAWAPAQALAEINFLHFAVLLFAISIVAMVGVSLASAPPDPKRLQDLTVATLKPASPADAALEKGARRGDIALSALLLLVIAAVWTVFSH